MGAGSYDTRKGKIHFSKETERQENYSSLDSKSHLQVPLISDKYSRLRRLLMNLTKI